MVPPTDSETSTAAIANNQFTYTLSNGGTISGTFSSTREGSGTAATVTCFRGAERTSLSGDAIRFTKAS